MVWTGNNADDFELLWDGMQVELWLKLEFGQLALADWVIIEVFISDRFGLMAARECDQGCEALIISFFDGCHP